MPTITISVSDQMRDFAHAVVEDGTYSNISEVFRDGLRAVQERQLRQQALQRHILKAVENGGSHTEEEIETAVFSHLSRMNDIGD